MADLEPFGGRFGTLKSYAHVTILSSAHSPEEMAAAVGLPPDSAWAKADLRRPGGRSTGRHKFNGITYDSPARAGGDGPHEHLEQLVARLRPHSEQLRALAGEEGVDSVRLWLVQQTTSRNPAFSVSPALLAAIAEMGASLDLDIYVLDDDEETPAVP